MAGGTFSRLEPRGHARALACATKEEWWTLWAGEWRSQEALGLGDAPEGLSPRHGAGARAHRWVRSGYGHSNLRSGQGWTCSSWQSLGWEGTSSGDSYGEGLFATFQAELY